MHSTAVAGTTRHSVLLITALAAALFISSAGCSSTSSPAGRTVSDTASQPQPPSTPIASELTTGSLPPNLERALTYLEAQPALAPSALLVLDVLRRWYGFAVFPDLADRYRIALRNGNAAQLPEDWQSPYLRVMQRVISPVRVGSGKQTRWENFAPEMLAKGGINVITIPALYCDQVPYPMAYASILEAGLRTGGYELTHVGMALRWIDENGCSSPMDASFEPTVARAIAELANPADGVTDLEIEASAVLMYLGRRDLVRADMIDAIANAQRPNGGWSTDSADKSIATSWHPTAMALWALLGQHAPDVEMSPMIVSDEATQP